MPARPSIDGWARRRRGRARWGLCWGRSGWDGFEITTTALMLNPLLGAFVAYMGRLHLQGWHVRKDVCSKEGRTLNCMWVAAVGRRVQAGDDGGGNGKGVQVDTWTPMKLETKGAGLGCVLVASVHLVASSFFGGARLVCIVRFSFARSFVSSAGPPHTPPRKARPQSNRVTGRLLGPAVPCVRPLPRIPTTTHAFARSLHPRARVPVSPPPPCRPYWCFVA